MAGAPASRPWWRSRPVVGVIATLSAFASVLLFGSAGRDDSYITFWEAEQLADHGRLVNINGARIEQSSSLAHVVLLAFLHVVTRAPIPLLGVIVGAVCLIVTICLAAYVADELRPGAGLPTALACATAFPLMYWSTGGLETLFASVAVLWFAIAVTRALHPGPHTWVTWVSLLASSVLVETVRPDTMIVAACVGVVVVIKSLVVSRMYQFKQWAAVFDLRHAWRIAAVVVGVGVALAAFREAYFHSLLPQPDLAKAGGLSTLSEGAQYLGNVLPWWVSTPLLAGTVAGVVVCVRQRRAMGIVATPIVALGVLSDLFTRGDWMGGARLLVPYLPLAIALAVVGLSGLPALARRPTLALAVLGELALLVAFVNGAVWLSPTESAAPTNDAYAIAADTGAPMWSSWQWPGGALPTEPWYTADNGTRMRDAEFLKLATPILRDLVSAVPTSQQITIASDQAGYVIYTWANDYPHRLRFYDTANVVTKDLESCPGVQGSRAGEIMTWGNWVLRAGTCAPPLPDVIFDVGTINSYPALLAHYHVVVSADVVVHRTGLGATVRGGGPEFLAIRDGWTP